MSHSPCNPILPGFHPDPSICRVKNDYYLVTSSFQWFPGVPIFHSLDLQHWEPMGHVLTRPSQLPLQNAASSGGIFAPTLRYHAGLFYLITTNISAQGNFFVTARDPRGPWSDPVWLDLPGIDPSLFFDANGKTYIQSTGDGQGIIQSEFNPKTGNLLTPPRMIWPGTGGRYPEAPHLYRIGQLYYLMISEGGTEYGHMVTLARSASPWGPFASCPRNPILTHRNTQLDQPIQGTGHADWVEDVAGHWWMVFLGFRPIKGYFHHLGRETFLAPLTWEADGWPLVNQGRLIDWSLPGPLPAAHPTPAPPIRDDFTQTTLGGEWNFLRNPSPFWSLQEKPGCLRLHGLAHSLDQATSPALIARRLQHLTATVSTQLDFVPQQENAAAGITLFLDEQHHAELYITRQAGVRMIQLRRRIGSLVDVTSRPLADNHPVILQIQASREFIHFAYLSGPAGMQPLGTLAAKYVSSEVAGGFTGVYIGLYATGNGCACRTPADFAWFEYVGSNQLTEL